MKLHFRPPNDGQPHRYCPGCQQERLRSKRVDGKLTYECKVCPYIGGRALIIDPAINWWIDDDGEYWHETSGIFVRNRRGQFLFFERMTYPFGLAVPAGHVDRAEQPHLAARRELREETGLEVRGLKLIATENMLGDQCRRGSDAHRWHGFRCTLPGRVSLTIDPREGSRPAWHTLEEAMRRKLTFATKYFIRKNGRQLNRP